MILNLIWDVDGTLFDTYPAFVNAFSRALKDLNLAVPMDRISRLARVSLSHCSSTLSHEYGLDEEILAARFNKYYAAIGMEYQKPFAGVREVCEYIQKLGGINVIATHRRPESTNALLEAHAMKHLFADLVTPLDGLARKPDPALFLMLIERNRLKPEETLVIGDRGIDIQAGISAGVRNCLFRPTERGVQADLIVEDYLNLLRFLKSENEAVNV